MRHLSHTKNKTNKCKITFSKLFADNPAKKPKSASMKEKKKGGGGENKRKRTGSKYKKNKDNKQQKKENKIHPLSNPLIL